MLGENCGGQFTYLPNGIKDCSGCILPHVKEKGYEHVAGKMKEVMKITQKNKECKDEDK
jgi:Zn-finger protein